MNWSLLYTCLAVALLGGAEVAAQQASPRGPDETVRAVLRADSLRDWRTLLSLTHPDALREFRDYEVRWLRSDPDGFPGMMPLSKCMRDQVAAGKRFHLDSVYHVSSVGMLEALPLDTVFARFRVWQAHFPRVSPNDSVAPRARLAYLGHVAANDSTVYGIVEEGFDPLPTPDWPARRPHILTLRRVGAEWKTMLDVDFLQGGARIQMYRGCH